MPANTILASNRINASVAGQTSPKAASPPPATAPLNNVVSSVTGTLSNVLAGGIHPEADVTPTVDTSLDRATDSVRGVLGGLRPRGTGVLSPGPSGESNAAAAVASGAKRITDAGAPAANAVRKFFNTRRTVDVGGPPANTGA